MSAQTNYKFNTPMGGAGGIVDIAPYAIDTFMNEEATGTVKYGVGVVYGTNKASQVKLPGSSAAAGDFVGIATNNRVTEFTTEGELVLRNGLPIGVMRYGRVYARVAPSSVSSGVATYPTIANGDALYLITSGNYVGQFTNASSGNVAVKGRFLSAVDTSMGIAMVELFNQAQA